MKFLSILIIIFFSCNNSSSGRKLNIEKSLIDTTINDYEKIITEREQASAEKQTDYLGTLVAKISFNVKTNNNQDFEDGIQPWISIEDPAKDLPQLIDKETVIIPDTSITIIIDYPLNNKYRVDLISKTGFTKETLIKEISEQYHKVYAEEEETSTIKTIPVDKRVGIYNRNETDGKYGIWGHDIADLVLTEVLVYKTQDGQIILSLDIES